MSDLEITLGALADPVSLQLINSPIPKDVLKQFDRDADALVRLHLRGFLPDSAVTRIRKKLMRNITAAYIKAHNVTVE